MQFIFFGLITGSVLAVAAVGFAMVRQLEGFLNIAHGQYLLIGALLGLGLMQLGLNVYVAGLLTVVLVGTIGMAIAWLVFFPLRYKGLLAQFFTSIGVAFVLYGLVLATWTGSGIKVYPISFGRLLTIGDLRMSVGEIILIAIAWLSVLSLHLFLTRTSLGIWIRAVASNRELARARGVRSDLVMSVVWFLASAFAGLAGVMIGALGSVHSELGWQYILTILAVAVMGGVGNLYGVMAAGLILGFVIDLSSLAISSKYGTIVAFSVIILTLVVRPEGLFSIQRRQEAGQ
jgi:neutral amino acid transport system permease protein